MMLTIVIKYTYNEYFNALSSKNDPFYFVSFTFFESLQSATPHTKLSGSLVSKTKMTLFFHFLSAYHVRRLSTKRGRGGVRVALAFAIMMDNE